MLSRLLSVHVCAERAAIGLLTVCDHKIARLHLHRSFVQRSMLWFLWKFSPHNGHCKVRMFAEWLSLLMFGDRERAWGQWRACRSLGQVVFSPDTG
ncbi:hypothetical protein BaRGS_00000525 [Batillaria attramentaria]|uniref:Secreted protein n=1 Tax=Batillaria attramentaria TaxID=370345 RepID=A0ABD0MA15_9CAEN